jgi:hypothetical protein
VSGSFTSSIKTKSGTLVPKNSPSTTGNLSLHSGARIELRHSVDSLSICGNVSLIGNLDIIAAPGLTPGSTDTTLNKTNNGAISYIWTISYTGGDGNDVTLTATTMVKITC